jgi:hypothetical protein
MCRLVLEFCNRGCVADAISKGWFRRKDSMEADMATVLVSASTPPGLRTFHCAADVL